MKKMMVNEFLELVRRGDWRRDQSVEISAIMERQEIGAADEFIEDPLLISHVWGVSSITSRFEDISIVYSETFEYDEFEPDSFVTSIEGVDEVWVVSGVLVVDDSGEPLDQDQLAEILPSVFSEINYDGLNIDKVVRIDSNSAPDSTWQEISLRASYAPDVCFNGILLGSAVSTDEQGVSGIHSDSLARWTEIHLYKTAGGKFVCQRSELARQSPYSDFYTVRVCDTVDDVKNFIGQSDLAESLLKSAGIHD